MVNPSAATNPSPANVGWVLWGGVAIILGGMALLACGLTALDSRLIKKVKTPTE